MSLAGGQRRVGPYEIEERIGAGGMAIVWLARDTRDNRMVALKILSEILAAEPRFRQRFRREAELATRIDSPHVVKVLDFGDADGRTYLAMEYVQGISLSQQIRAAGVLPVEMAVEFVRQTALGLEAAHAQGIIHRDIKPANLMLVDGIVKIMDFGIARETDVTASSTRMFTPQYASPEQIKGEPPVDHRTDLYSLGVTFYHLLTGAAPFSSTSEFELARMQVQDPPPPIRLRRTGVPDSVAMILDTLLQKDADERYSDADELLRELSLVDRGREVPPPADSALPGDGAPNQGHSVRLSVRAPVPEESGDGSSAAGRSKASRRRLLLVGGAGGAAIAAVAAGIAYVTSKPAVSQVISAPTSTPTSSRTVPTSVSTSVPTSTPVPQPAVAVTPSPTPTMSPPPQPTSSPTAVPTPELSPEVEVVEEVVEVEAEVVTTRFSFWFNQPTRMADFEQKIVAHYHRYQNAYRMEPILVPNNEITTKMTQAIAGGTPPDLIRVGGGTLANAMFRQRVMHSIDEFDPTVRDNEDIIWAVRATLTWNNKIWAMPTNSGTTAFYYNRGLYDAAGIGGPPSTFVEMAENARRVQSLGSIAGNRVGGMEWPTEPKLGTANTMFGVLFGFGVFGVNQRGTHVLFNSAKMREAVTWWKENFVDSGTMPIKQNLNETGMTNDFGTGLVGQYVAWPSRLEAAVESLGSDVGLTARMPAGPKSNFMPIGFGELMLPTNAANTEGGWHFTDFVGNDAENNSIWCAALDQIPPRFSYWETDIFSAYLAANPATQPFVDGQKSAFPQYWGPAVNQIWTTYGEAQEAVAFGFSPASALNLAQEKAQASLDLALQTDGAVPREFPELSGGYED